MTPSGSSEPCATCGGSGRITEEEVVVGYGFWSGAPIFGDIKRKCPDCQVKP